MSWYTLTALLSGMSFSL